ncbi:MAG: lysozyme inhibitor LprI family protein [Pseudomonadota bacterium]|uniref:lysozyme inhibitor LprI family protein n=1 Tax=Sphingomonas sp. ERG5 TaxID=1381597 RepID=UPI00054B23B2|nr:lysozyme inhibitor LprI family protein [Sphingomonas sp. ERG5]
MAMRGMVTLIIAAAAPAAHAAPERDATEAALDRCLELPANASTAGQVDCEQIAAKAYDRRMNLSYGTLMRRLPAKAAHQLQQSQRAWLVYRDGELSAQSSLYATRQGTMYVPMQADSAVTLTRDRARLLESYVRVMAIE